ncbi:hypothetical protein [Amycolatopsis rubida]|uniref:Terminase small subunit n=1 Tax=Amycolatopsis rubida TaxID=112413 RepID=A0A1I5IHF0_9PSEU|nr:hypothetical protein [Amycolatopsis rubida]SFO59975.1 hypothetical protein SAMN05421854_102472 [Amycolatopsis rubida]
MPSGGARNRSGPAPDPNALNRDRPSDKAGWTVLPAEGRTAPAPRWPLVDRNGREAEVWESFWRKPQALLWERDGLVEYVALFVRQLVEAEQERASAENRKTVRMMFADLYLTPDSMARARIRIVADEAVEPKKTPAKAAPRKSARSRLTVVPDGGGA